MENYISDSVVMALYLKEHPGSIVSTDTGYFKYDNDLGYFLYCNPNNKVRNGWYRARGLDSHLRNYLRSNIC